jgi:hypothetical protein
MKMLRLVVAGTLLCVVGCPPRLHGDSNIKKAKTDLLTLEKAILTYKAMYGAWPDSLQSMAKPDSSGRVGLIKDNLLVDPWGRPYQFDVTQVHPETGAILIWSDGANPGEPGSAITNWPTTTDFSFWNVLRSANFWIVPVAAVTIALGYVRWRYFEDDAVRGRASRMLQVALEIAIVLLIGVLLVLLLLGPFSPTFLA